MEIPLFVRLKKETHRNIASAQDLIVHEVYNLLPKAVLHGGTGIWRCYYGKIFSEDLDFYFPKDVKRIEILFNNLERMGFKILKKKISEKSVYSELEINRVSVRLEATFQRAKGIICDYELCDGNIIKIYSLSIEDFMIEKINTYLKRQKIRDLWDVFFLIRSIRNPNTIKEIKKLIENFKEPIDKEDLKTIILEGIVPSVKEMLDYIKRKWENKYI